MEGRYQRSIALSLPSIFFAHRPIMMLVLEECSCLWILLSIR
eukprot:SAG31_NODE_17593_length_665_cov_0.980565_1_plen_41_part_01